MTRLTSTMPRFAAVLIALGAGLCITPQSALAQEADIRQMTAFVELMQGFFKIIDSLHAVSDDPEKAAIFHLHKIQEVYEEQGNKARVAPVMRDVLKRSSSPTIRAATYLMLGDVLKEDGQRDAAIEVLRKGLDEAIDNAERGR